MRAFRSRAHGEWSAPSVAIRLPNFPPPEQTPIMEIPGSWVTVDVAGVEELKEDLEREVAPVELAPTLA